MRKINTKTFIWLILAIAASTVCDLYPPAQGPAAAIFFVTLIGFFHSILPKRIPARKIKLVSILLGISFGLIALGVAGRIYGALSGVMAKRAISVFAAPFYEEVLKVGGVCVLALRSKRSLKSWRTAILCGLLAGLVFGVGEGIAQPSVWRPLTAATHTIDTAIFALGIRFMVIGKSRRNGVLAGICMGGPILEHMAWNAFAVLAL